MRESRSISIELSNKITKAIAVLVLGGILGISLFAGKVVTKFAQRNAESSLQTFTKEVEDNLGEIENMARSVNLVLNSHLGEEGYFESLGSKIASYDSRLVSASISREAGTEEEKLAIEKGQPVWGEPHRAPGDTIPVVSMSAPLYGPGKNVIGVYSADVSISKLSEKLRGSHFYEKSYAVLTSAKGTFIFHPVKKYMLDYSIFDIAGLTGDDKLAESGRKMISGEKGIGAIRAEKSVAIYGPVKNGWSVAIVCPFNEIFGSTINFQIIILLISLLDLLVIYLVTKAIINRTLLPITEMTYAAMNIGKGNFKAQIPEVSGGGELRKLHDSLDYMLQSINDYIYQLKHTTAENERYESELNIASKIQKQMLRTDFIHNEDIDLYATLRPAKEVGGDMYDFRVSGRYLFFAVGDVSGKGVPAALYMAISRSLFHYVSGFESVGSNNVVASINNSFCAGNDNNMFITLFVGKLNLDTGELLFCNAGHNPIVIVSPEGKAEFLIEKTNLAAGVLDEFQYEKESVTIRKGSRLIIYTDGISEAEDVHKKLYGEGRLLAFAESQGTDTSSEAFVNNLMSSVKAFTGDNEQNDDITVMSIRF